MKKFFIMMMQIATSTIVFTQNNLITNSSFEEHTSCPINSGEIWKSTGWYGVNTVEYYNECSSSVGVPYNFMLNFQPAKTGVAYSGLIFFQANYNPPLPMYYFNAPDPYREWLGTKIAAPLINGKKYCGGFYTNKHNGANIAIENFGIYFSQDSLINIPFPLTIEGPFPNPQIKIYKGIISDTLNWLLMDGVFTAQGNEKYMIIGNYLRGDSVNFSVNNDSIPQSMFASMSPYWPFGGPHIAYYFIDDVSLYELNKTPTAQNHAYNCAANTVTLKADTGFNFRWYYLPDTVNVLGTADTFVVDASTAKNVLLRATLCSTEFTDTVAVPKLDCTGIENNALAQGATLFPNPANSIATFTLQGTPPPGTTLHLTDLNGRELRNYAVKGKTTELHLQELSAGVYVLSYRYKENVIWKGKLAVMK